MDLNLTLDMIYDLPNKVNVSPTYNFKDWMSQRSTMSQQERIVMEKYDNMIWASKFYESIISLSKGLTKNEAIFLTYGLIANRTNEFMAELMSVSVRTVDPIKKSCMVKAWLALETLYEEDKK